MTRDNGLKHEPGSAGRMASHFGVDVAAAIERQLTAWLELMVEWNRSLDLTAARSGDELADLMLADAFALAPRLPPGARVVDVGSGAGAPGLPIALLRPDLHVTLVEPLSKRVSFLRTVLASVSRLDVTVTRARVEALPSGDRWDVALSRATLAPAAWLEAGRALVTEGGSVWVLLAKDEPPGGAIEGVRLSERVEYTWPRQGHTRHAARYERVALPER